MHPAPGATAPTRFSAPGNRRRAHALASLALLLTACGDDTDGAGGGDATGSGGQAASTGNGNTSGNGAGGDGATSTGNTGTSATGSGGSGAGGSATGGGTGGSGGGSGEGGGGGGAPALPECGDRELAPNPWLEEEFADVPVLSGDFTSRQFVELPRLVRDATATSAKYAFDLREEEAPADPRAAFVNVTVTDLVSPDRFGGAIQTANAPGTVLFLSNVHLEPNWPAWESYDSTNYDGLVLDDSEEIFAEDLTISAWNADSAADIKSQRAQLVCLVTEGDGNRTLRFWQAGPHYIVKSSVNNGTGDVVWMQDCTATTIRVYDSTFNGEPMIPADRISCENGSDPTIEYLDVDPRTTGEMHPMFSAVP